MIGTDAGALTRRELLVLGGLAAVGLRGAPGALAAAGALEGQLNIYNWAQYQDPSNLKAFSKK
jgi:spermidine/putrescine-binding protein